MEWYYDVLIGLVAIALIVWVSIYRMQKKLLLLWKEVSSKEVSFYRKLENVLKHFLENKELLTTADNIDFMKKISRYRKKRVRALLLNTRQTLFNAINVIYDEIEDDDSETYKELKKEFVDLQKSRRIYNSRVLIYNQTISVFPTRYLALRMNLELKEYFG